MPVEASQREELQKLINKELGPKAKLRVDGTIEEAGSQWLLLIPSKPAPTESSEALTLSYKSHNGDLLLSNSWIYTPIISGKTPNSLTIRSFDFYPQIIQDNILSSIISPEFVIPKGFVLPRDLAMLAGRLPIAFADVELASHREEAFRRRLKEEEASHLSLLSYDYSSALFRTIDLEDKSEAKIRSLDLVSSKISFLTVCKNSPQGLLLADYNRSIIYKLKAPDQLEEYLKLPLDAGPRDFAFSADGTLFYVLNTKIPSIYIYKTDGLKLIKELPIPAASFALTTMDSTSQQADYMLFASKSSSELSLLSSFDHRISSRISLAAEGLMPEAYSVSAGKIFLIAKPSKGGPNQLLVIDTVSLKREILKLESEALAITSGAGFIYVATRRSVDGHSLLLKINPEDLSIQGEADLSTDIIDPSSIVLTKTQAFALIACSGGDVVGLVDLNSMQLLKKLNISSKAHHLILYAG